MIVVFPGHTHLLYYCKDLTRVLLNSLNKLEKREKMQAFIRSNEILKIVSKVVCFL